MFSGASNIIIHGGTFINVKGDMYRASPSETTDENVSESQDPEPESKNEVGDSGPKFCAPHDQRATNDQYSHENPLQEANSKESCTPRTPSSLSRSAKDFETPAHISERVLEYGLYLTPMPSITPSEVKSCQPNFFISHSHGSTNDWFPHRNPNAQDPCKPQIGPAATSTKHFGTPISVWIPESSPKFMPITPEITHQSEDKRMSPLALAKSVDLPRRDANPNDISHSPQPRFPMPQPQAATHALPNQFRARHPTFPQPEHFQFGTGRRSCYCPVRASTYPFPAPSPPSATPSSQFSTPSPSPSFPTPSFTPSPPFPTAPPSFSIRCPHCFQFEEWNL